MLEGGRVLTVEPDKHHVWMAHKQHAAGYQMWRLEESGCLRNMEHMDRCLGIVGHSSGSGLELQIDNDLPIHHWKFEDKYIVNLVSQHSISVRLSSHTVLTSNPTPPGQGQWDSGAEGSFSERGLGRHSPGDGRGRGEREGPG